MPRRAIWAGRSPVMSSPRKRIVPAVTGQEAGQQIEHGGLARAIGADQRVDAARDAPSGLTSLTATKPLNSLVRPRVSRMRSFILLLWLGDHSAKVRVGRCIVHDRDLARRRFCTSSAPTARGSISLSPLDPKESVMPGHKASISSPRRSGAMVTSETRRLSRRNVIPTAPRRALGAHPDGLPCRRERNGARAMRSPSIDCVGDLAHRSAGPDAGAAGARRLERGRRRRGFLTPLWALHQRGRGADVHRGSAAAHPRPGKGG